MAVQAQSQREKPYVVVDFMDLEPERFSFDKPKKGEYGLSIGIKYDGKMLFVRYPRKIAPFGIGRNENPKNKDLNGFTVSLSFEKDYENDAVFQQAQRLHEFFGQKCVENGYSWGLGGTEDIPPPEVSILGYDKHGDRGLWKGLIKWSYRVKENNKKEWLDYPPRMDIGVPGTVNKDKTAGTITVSMFNADGAQINGGPAGTVVNSENVESYCPKFSDVSVLAAWGRLSQGQYGISLKPQAKQMRVYPRSQLPVDECLLTDENDSGAEMMEFNDVSMLGGPAQPMSVPETESEPQIQYQDTVQAPVPVAPKPSIGGPRAVRRVVTRTNQ